MFRTLLRKELLELLRTHKVIITFAVFAVAGLISPLVAKYTPLLLENIPDMPPGFADMIPEPTTQDAIAQYVKNVSQFGVILVIVLTMGSLAGEKERGTAAMLLSKPVRPSAVIVAKWLAGILNILAGLSLAAICNFFYTYLLFEPLNLGDYFLLNALMAIFLCLFLSLALLASTLARTQAMAAAGAFAGLALVLLLGAIPRVKEAAPGKLLNWGSALVLGGDASAWAALGLTLALISLCVLGASLYFEREEI